MAPSPDGILFLWFKVYLLCLLAKWPLGIPFYFTIGETGKTITPTQGVNVRNVRAETVNGTSKSRLGKQCSASKLKLPPQSGCCPVLLGIGWDSFSVFLERHKRHKSTEQREEGWIPSTLSPSDHHLCLVTSELGINLFPCISCPLNSPGT